MAIQFIPSVLGAGNYGKKMEYNFYFMKCAIICHNFINMLFGWEKQVS